MRSKRVILTEGFVLELPVTFEDVVEVMSAVPQDEPDAKPILSKRSA